MGVSQHGLPRAVDFYVVIVLRGRVSAFNTYEPLQL